VCANNLRNVCQQVGRGGKAAPAKRLRVVVWLAPKVNKITKRSVAETGLSIPRYVAGTHGLFQCSGRMDTPTSKAVV